MNRFQKVLTLLTSKATTIHKFRVSKFYISRNEYFFIARMP